MILWTIHKIQFWEKLQEKRILHGDGRRIWHCFREPYRWMIRQMRKRLPNCPPGCNYPLWAWYQFDGVRRKRPDLRSVGHSMKNTRMVRIEFEIDKHEALLSNLLSWSAVLNNYYCCENEEDMEEFEMEIERDGFSDTPRRDLPVQYKERIEKSWERIFDLNIGEPIEEKVIQATFWELRLDMVRNVKEFNAR